VKFSKTLGYGIEPWDVIEKFGTDAVRFTSVQLAPLGGRIRMSVEDFEAGGRFVNKIWNAARFLLGNIKPGSKIKALEPKKLDLAGQWLLHELATTAEKIDKNLEQFRLNDAVDDLYQYIWGSFCDWGLESAKNALTGNDDALKERTISLLVYVLDGILRLASPVMPFVTEEIWQQLPHHPNWDRPESLVIAKFPEETTMQRFPEAAAKWKRVQDLISGIRSVRSQAGAAPKTALDVFVKADAEGTQLFKEAEADIKRLGMVKNLVVGIDTARPGQCLVSVGRGYEAFIPAVGLLDIPKEKQRLEGEITRLSKILQGIQTKLNNKNFVDRAPADILEQTTAQKLNLESQVSSLQKNLEALS
jgi:valyl-tRNA synthetase